MVVTNFYPPHHIGGYELRCREVADRMVRRGHDVHVLTSLAGHAAEVDSTDDDQSAGSAPTTTRVLSNIQWGPPFPPESLVGLLQTEAADRVAVARIIRNHTLDVIDIWGMEFASQPLALSLAAGLVPVHFTLEDVWLCSTWRNDPLLMIGEIARKLEVSITPRTAALLGPGLHVPDVSHAAVTFVSHALARRYGEVGSLHPSSRIRSAGIDLSRFTAGRPPAAPPFVILNVGRLTECRGQADIIAALIALRRNQPSLPPLVLRLVGEMDAGFAGNLRAMADGASGLTLELCGPITPSQIPDVYRSTHLFVHASRLPEGLPIALMEAMAAGVPVIATDTGGQRDILDDGRWGRLIPSRRPDLMAQAIADAIGHYDNWRDKAAIAREHARRAFDIETYVDGHIEDLQHAAAQPPGGAAPCDTPPDDPTLIAFEAQLREAARSAASAFDAENDPDGAWRLGTVLKRCRALAEARQLFEQLARVRSPRGEDIRRSAFHLGEIAMIQTRWDAAEAALRTCLDLVPDHRKALYDLDCVRSRRLPDHLQGLKP